jgi:hypothetical protein
MMSFSEFANGDATQIWGGVLLAPVATLLQLQAAYMFVPWACNSGHRWMLVATNLLFLAIAAFGGVLAINCWKKPDADVELARQRRFFAALGLLTSALFCLVIIAQGIPFFSSTRVRIKLHCYFAQSKHRCGTC